MKISVIMGAYNCSSTLSLALESLLNQTFEDFNVIICDDGSTDETYKIMEKYKKKYPKKFIILQNKKNMGLNYTLNKCLKNADGEYIARMDADDLSERKRFEIQNKFLDNHKEYAFVSSNMIYFDENGDWGVSNSIDKPIADDFVHSSPFCHAPVMIRKEAYLNVGGYTVEPNLLRVEDYHLWIKLYEKGYRGYNIKQPLYKMRDDKDAYSRRNFKNRINEMYVKILAVKKLNLPMWKSIYSIRPILVGILPHKLYDYLHKKRLKEN